MPDDSLRKLAEQIEKWFKMQPDCGHLKPAHAYKLAEFLKQTASHLQPQAPSEPIASFGGVTSWYSQYKEGCPNCGFNFVRDGHPELNIWNHYMGSCKAESASKPEEIIIPRS